MHIKNKKVFLIIFSSIFFALVLLPATLLFAYQKTYAGKIYRNVYISDINLSGKTKAQAINLVKKDIENVLNKSVTLKSGEKVVSAKYKDTGIIFDVEKAIDESYKIGRPKSFYQSLIASTKTYFKKNTIEIEPKLNQAQYDEFVKVAVAQFNFEPKDATLAIENGQIVETQSSDGQVADTTNLAEDIQNAMFSNKNEVEVSSQKKSPALSSVNFQTAKTEAETYLNKDITFSYQDKIFKPTRAEIGNWVQFENINGQVTTKISDSNIKAYLNKIAKNFEINKIDKRINALTNEVIEEGKEGLYLNKDQAMKDLKASLTNASLAIALVTYTEAPSEVKVMPSEGLVPGRFAGKYVDIDLTNQKLCRVEGNNIIDCFTVSSGKPSMPTPTGTFSITGKNPKQWSGRYGLWMPYWQQFNGDYGIHELPEWPGGYKEGQEHLGIPVSHGCVRLGIGDAATVYNWTEIGTPVYIHK